MVYTYHIIDFKIGNNKLFFYAHRKTKHWDPVHKHKHWVKSLCVYPVSYTQQFVNYFNSLWVANCFHSNIIIHQKRFTRTFSNHCFLSCARNCRRNSQTLQRLWRNIQILTPLYKRPRNRTSRQSTENRLIATPSTSWMQDLRKIIHL